MDETTEKKGIGLFGLIGMVVSSCIGTGLFAITGQLAGVASPGAVLIAWLIVGIGFLTLAFALNNLVDKRPDLHGIFSYADAGWGPLAGFISGWGYWLSAWLGNVAFATMLMSTIGYFFPMFLAGNTLPCVIGASILTWGITFLIINGVESASFVNAIVMICKVAAIAITLIFSVFLFNAGVFTADFWGNVYNNAVAAGEYGADATGFGGIPVQVMDCMIIMMWCFIGIEGASVVSGRAQKKSDVGKATVIGFIALMVIYVGASVLPYGYMPYTEIASLDYPALLYVFNSMAPGWGGPFIAIAIIISIAGAWLSFTLLPAETTSDMAAYKLLPASWGKLNKKGAPQMSLLIVGACVQVFLIICMFSSDAYDFAFSMCTVAIVVTWAFAAAYQVKWGLQNKQPLQTAIGAIAVVFQVVAVLFNGWSYLLLTCVGYIPGFFFYGKGRKDNGHGITKGEWVAMIIISALGVLSLVLLFMGVISI